MDVEEYAKRFGVDIETAATHLALISLIETAPSSEQSRQWMFQVLIQAVDPHKFVAAMRGLAKEIVEPVEGSVSQDHEEPEVKS
jgi:hypothetical protein